jgi:hypothetical protein
VGVAWREGTVPSLGGRWIDKRAEFRLPVDDSLIDKWPILPASSEMSIDTEGRGLAVMGGGGGCGNVQWAWFVADDGGSGVSRAAERQLVAGGGEAGDAVRGDDVSGGRGSRRGAQKDEPHWPERTGIDSHHNYMYSHQS